MSLDHDDVLHRQQQHIPQGSALIDYVLAAAKRGGERLTMGDALAGLLADITEAARTIGSLLQTRPGDPKPHSSLSCPRRPTAAPNHHPPPGSASTLRRIAHVRPARGVVLA